MYAGKDKASIEKKVNLRRVNLDEQMNSRTKFILSNSDKKYKLQTLDSKEKYLWISAIKEIKAQPSKTKITIENHKSGPL